MNKNLYKGTPSRCPFLLPFSNKQIKQKKQTKGDTKILFYTEKIMPEKAKFYSKPL